MHKNKNLFIMLFLLIFCVTALFAQTAFADQCSLVNNEYCISEFDGCLIGHSPSNNTCPSINTICCQSPPPTNDCERVFGICAKTPPSNKYIKSANNEKCSNPEDVCYKYQKTTNKYQVLKSSLFNYQLLEKIPGKEGVGGNDLSQYITAIYDTALVIVVLSAVLMASIGGFMYLTSAGNTAAMGTAKGVIFDAVIGLVIALAAWLLLNVVNPDLVNVKIKSLSVITATNVPSAPTPIPKPGERWPDDSSIRGNLASVGIQFNAGNCLTEGQMTRCTSVSGLGKAAIDGLKEFKNGCECSVTITGGTEYWLHGDKQSPATTTHRPGNSVVDIWRQDILAYLQKSATVQCSITNRPVYRLNGADYWDEDDKHFHVNYGQTICK